MARCGRSLALTLSASWERLQLLGCLPGFKPPSRPTRISFPLWLRLNYRSLDLQLDLDPQPKELPLPAPVVLQIFNAAVSLAAQLAGSAQPDSADVHLLRSLLAISLIFMTCSRPVSIAALGVSDVTLCPTTSLGLVVRRTYVKTARGMGDGRPGRYSLQFPTATFGPFISALQTFVTLRQRHAPQAQFFFQLPTDSFTMPPETNGSLAGPWLTLALQHITVNPPQGFVWTPRSLRSGAATACEKANIPRSTTEFLGGWAPRSVAVDKHYIDPSMPPSAAGRFFFAHLLADSAATTWQPL